MYTFIIKNNKTYLEVALTRSMLAIAAVAACMFPKMHYFFLSYALSALLLVMALFAKYISVKLSSGKWGMLLVAAAILFFIFGSLLFPSLMLAYAAVLKFLVVDPVINITVTAIIVKRNYTSKAYHWSDFNNIVLKDGLLSLDFTDNKIKYFTITEAVNELAFNAFCSSKLGAENN